MFFDYTDILIGLQISYHIEGLGKEFDTFVCLALGYCHASVDSDSWFGNWGVSESGLFVSAHATMRYWLNSSLGIQARLNFGNIESSIGLGVDFKF